MSESRGPSRAARRFVSTGQGCDRSQGDRFCRREVNDMEVISYRGRVWITAMLAICVVGTGVFAGEPSDLPRLRVEVGESAIPDDADMVWIGEGDVPQDLHSQTNDAPATVVIRPADRPQEAKATPAEVVEPSIVPSQPPVRPVEEVVDAFLATARRHEVPRYTGPKPRVVFPAQHAAPRANVVASPKQLPPSENAPGFVEIESEPLESLPSAAVHEPKPSPEPVVAPAAETISKPLFAQQSGTSPKPEPQPTVARPGVERSRPLQLPEPSRSAGQPKSAPTTAHTLSERLTQRQAS
ncbi:MAG: hypothetical protein D6741_13655, partial [Planctomycetota bacterium]